MFGSMRLSWVTSLLADAAVLLRAWVLDTSVAQLPMFGLTTHQLVLDLPI